MNFLAALSDEYVIISLIALAFIVSLIVFLIAQARINRKARENMMKDLVKTQEAVFTNAAEALSEKLSLYTDGVLVEKVNGMYQSLITKDLLPSVNNAADTISSLAETVVKQQQEGMAELADALAELFASKMRDYIKQESEIVTSLQQSTATFSDRLFDISENINRISERYNAVYEQANAVSATVTEAAELMCVKVDKLGEMFENTAQTIGMMQTNVLENKDAVIALTGAASQIRQLADQSAGLLADQNQRTAELLNDAINTMQQSAAQSAQSVVEKLHTDLAATTELISSTVSNLSGVALKIESSATNFAEGISGSYNDLGININEKLADVAKALSDSVSEQYQRIISGTESFSDSFTQSITQFNDTLAGHITNLQFITQQLNNNVSTFNQSADATANKFELSMESSIADALSQMDNSIAEIIKRLAAVTSSIQEAADSLPKAVKSIKDM